VIAVISAPLYADFGINRRTGKVNRYYYNLGAYRNWHYAVSNKLKKHYKSVIRPQVDGMQFDYITLTFVLHRGDNRVVDRANILSIHEKFFCDALVECGCLPDDNDSYIKWTKYRTGGIDKSNPRVDIIVREAT